MKRRVDNDMAIDRVKLRGLYARLKGLERAIPSTIYANVGIGQDINDIANGLFEVTGETFEHFMVGPDEIFHPDKRERRWITGGIKGKLYQLTAYLENVYHVSSEIIEIGTLYNSIKDEELKGRCADLLSAPSNFDRAINQATQVLEDRIRTMSSSNQDLTGTQLVNTVIKSEIGKTVLKVSDDDGEQKGFADICRGVMFAFRNPTHHQISDKFGREDALKVCAFIDSLLGVIEKADVIDANK